MTAVLRDIITPNSPITNPRGRRSSSATGSDDSPSLPSLPVFAAGTRVVVAEDDKVSQAVLTLILQKLGLEVHMAPDGRRALELIREVSPSLVMMDMQMPEMDGPEAIKAMRADTAAPQPPVVVLSANWLSDSKCADLRMLGVTDFLIKPVDRARLHEALVRLLPKA
jgi:CheY-like chemotaxis protein